MKTSERVILALCLVALAFLLGLVIGSAEQHPPSLLSLPAPGLIASAIEED